jgi:uncharacterized delta-60 repeat protein
MKISSQRALLLGLLIGTALLLAAVTQAETWSFDPTFQRTPLRVTSESASGVKVLSSGKVLVYTINGALLSGANGQRIGALLRIDPDTGAIDPTWKPDPTLTASGFLGVAEAPDGKIYYSTALVGDLPDFATGSDPAVNRLVRLNTDGSRDPSFNSPVFAMPSRFVAVQPDGKIIVCSGGVNLGGVPPAGSIVQTVRLNTDGSLDNTFQSPNFQSNASDPPASVASGNYYDAGVFGDPVIDSATGKIYFCGFFKFVNGQPRKAIVRCNADGTLDSSFVPTGLIGGSTQLTARGILLQAGGKVVLGGTVLRTAAGGATRYALLRFNSDGTLDNTFTLVPTTTPMGVPLVPGYSGPRDIHALPGGNILTGNSRVLRFLANGTLDSTFTPLDYSSPFFTPNNGSVAAFRVDVNPTTGAAYLDNPGLTYTRLAGVPVGNITKLTPGGTIDTQFTSPVVESEDFAPEVQIASSGALYISGLHTAFGNTANATIARLFPDGTRDPGYSLDPTLPFADKQASDVALLSDGSAYVVYYSGAFNGGYSFGNLVRLLPTGALDTNFHLSSALQTALNVNAFDGNDRNKNPFPPLQISGAPSGKVYVFSGGAQATVNANGNLKPLRVNADGTEDTSMTPLGFPVGDVTRDATGITGGSTGYILRLGPSPDGGFFVLVSVAPFPTLTGDPYNYKVIKLLADGSRDPNFVSPVLESGEQAIQDFPVLFDPVSGFTTTPPNGFYREGSDRVVGLGIFPGGSILLDGDFDIAGSNPVIRSPIKLTATGALDSSFAVPSGVVQNLANPSRGNHAKARIAPDGKIWVLGRFDTAGGNPAPGVTRLNPDGSLDNTFSLTQVAYYDSFGDFADVVFANSSTAYLVGTFRHTGDPLPFAVTRILKLPAITSPLTAAGTVGQQFTYQLLATDATLLGASNLPAGLTFTASLGAITGTPTTSGTFSVGLSASNAAGTTNATLTLTVQPAPPAGPVITSSTSVTGRVGQAFSFQVFTTGGSSATRVSATGLPPGLVIDAVTGLISGKPTAEGSSAVSLTVTDGNQTTTNVLQLSFTADPTIPVIISSSSASLTPGQAFSYTIVAPATSDPSDVTTYTLVGTLPKGLFFDAKTGIISGTFTVSPQRNAGLPNHITLSGGIVTNVQLFATNSHGTSTIPLNFFLAPTGAVNIATRLVIGTGDSVLIAGFIITGNAPKKVIIRAIGPSLSAFGIGNALQDTTLELHDTGSTLGKNDDWRESQENEIIAEHLAPTDNRESAILATLIPGNYTAIVAGKNTSGIAVVEVYDLGTASLDSSSNSKLANIATRGPVLGGDNVMIGGFIVSGQSSTFVVRAIGPSLSAFGITGTLQDPTLAVKNSDGVTLIGNDDWQQGQPTEIQQLGLAPSDPRESALKVTLGPGQYTAVISGKGNATGVALVEVYGL